MRELVEHLTLIDLFTSDAYYYLNYDVKEDGEQQLPGIERLPKCANSSESITGIDSDSFFSVLSQDLLVAGRGRPSVASRQSVQVHGPRHAPGLAHRAASLRG